MFTLLRGYRMQWLRGDLVAGVTVAAIAIPESLGYATIAGLPVQTGLYCAVLPPLLFALVASSRQLVVGADSATAALVGATAAGVAAVGTAAYAGAVAALCVVLAGVLLVMAVLRLGFLADLISRPVLAGFLSGVGVSLIIGKLPGVLGIPASGTTWNKLVTTLTHLSQTNLASAVLGFAVVAVMVVIGRISPRWPGALIGVVGCSLLGVVIGAASRGVAMIGALPSGLPSVTLPALSQGEVTQLLPGAAAIAVVILAQSAAVARSFATKNDYRVDVDADLVALAAANAGSAITGGFAINGSPPRTAAGDSAGSRSQVVNITMAAVIGALLVVGAGLFDYVPEPVLAGVVLGIGLHLIKVYDLRKVARARRVEFATALLAMVVVAFVGVEQGILVAVLVSLLDRAYRTYEAPGEVLLQNGEIGPRAFERLTPVPPDQLAGVVAYRFGTSLFFANATKFDDEVRGLRAQSDPPAHTIVIDCGAMTDIDFTGADVLRKLGDDLSAAAGRVVLTDLSEEAVDTLRKTDATDAVIVLPHLEDAFDTPAAGASAAAASGRAESGPTTESGAGAPQSQP